MSFWSLKTIDRGVTPFCSPLAVQQVETAGLISIVICPPLARVITPAWTAGSTECRTGIIYVASAIHAVIQFQVRRTGISVSLSELLLHFRAFKLKEKDYFRSTLSRRQLQGFVRRDGRYPSQLFKHRYRFALVVDEPDGKNSVAEAEAPKSNARCNQLRSFVTGSNDLIVAHIFRNGPAPSGIFFDVNSVDVSGIDAEESTAQRSSPAGWQQVSRSFVFLKRDARERLS